MLFFLKEVVCGDLRYGRQLYDYQEGFLVVSVENEGEYYQPQGYALLFHPDLLLGTSLKAHIHEYSFFSYQVNEALHLSERAHELGFNYPQYFSRLFKLRIGQSPHEYRRTADANTEFKAIGE